MRVFCPRCESSYDRERYAERGEIECSCGQRFSLPRRRARHRRPPPGAFPRDAARAAMQLLGRRADRLCRLILSPQSTEIDIAMERHRLRVLAEELFPERMELYEMVFESRFERLVEQFRESDPNDA